MNKYFWYDKYNKLIVLVFIAIFIIQLATFLLDFWGIDKFNYIVNVITFIPFSLFIIVLKKSNKPDIFKKNNVKFFKLYSDSFFTDDSEEIPIDRTNHLKKLLSMIDNKKNNYEKGKLNCIFLTGDSGAGKSVLLKKMIQPTLESKGYQVIYYRKDYAAFKVSLSSSNSDKPTIIILDQFEDTIDNKKVKEELFECLNDDIKRFIFIFTFAKEKFAAIYEYLNGLFDYNEFDKKINDIVYFLKTDSADISSLMDIIALYISNITCQSSISVNTVKECYENYKDCTDDENHAPQLYILCSILKSIETNKMPFVSLFIFGSILENMFVENAYKYTKDPELLINDYLDMWISKFKNKENAKAVLFLLTDMKQYSFQDISRITFEPYTDNYQKALTENIFLSDKAENGLFILIHDYAAKQIIKYCDNISVAISPDIKYNVKHYCEEVKHIDGKNNNEKERSVSNRLDHQTKLKKIIEKHCFLMLFVTLAIEIFTIFTGQTLSPYERIFKMFLTISCGCSMYYIYIICSRLLSIYPLPLYFITGSIGTLAIWLCYIFPQFWGVFIGFELIIYGISQKYISKKTFERASKKFKTSCISFILIGFVVMILGVIYSGLINNSNNQIPPNLFVYHTMYIFLILLSIRAHANQEYILTHIGYINKI